MITLPRAARTHESVIRYFEAAGLDYGEWSPAFNMHFGYYARGMNPFKLEPMLDQMTGEVYRRLTLDSLREPLVLDLGCGLGAPARFMARRHPDAQFIGATITPWQVEQGNRLTEAAGLDDRVMLVEADYLDLPYPLESADAAFALESACYGRGKDKWDFIHALHGVLKPGGRFVIADCFRRNTRPMPRLLERAYRHCCACWALDEMAEINLFTRSLERAGFEDVTVEDISWNVAPSVAHVPWISLKFLAKTAVRRELRTLDRHRRNNVIAPLLGILLGMSRPHFRYCLVSGRKP
jgi:MPBQ/MSBQ methyltransferase